MLVVPLLRTALAAVTAAAVIAATPAPGSSAPAAPAVLPGSSAPAGSTVDPRAGFVDAPATAPVGWTGPLTVAWLNYDVSQHYTVEVTGPGYSFVRRLWIPEATSVRRRVAIDALPAAGDYTASFRDASGALVVDHRLRVVDPVALEVGAPSPATFLPLVRDGYRDDTRVTYRVDRVAHVTGRVSDAGGRVVHEVDLGEQQPGAEHSWTWTGAVSGTRLDRGRYTLSLLATADGTEAEASGEVRVASYRVPVRRAVRRPGISTATRDPGACRLAPRAGGALAIDCQGAPPSSRGAVVTWRFHPGTAAHGVRWRFDASGVADRPGGGVRTSRRRAGDTLLLTLRVLPGSSWTVTRAVASYRLRQQR